MNQSIALLNSSPESWYSLQLSPESSPEPSSDLTSTEAQLDDRSIEPCQSSSTTYDISISVRQIQKFVLKEVKVKLEHGHSIATTEEHLKNAAELLGNGQISTKWSSVIHYLKSLGYKDTKHCSVCLVITLAKDGRIILQNLFKTCGVPRLLRFWTKF